MVNKMSIDYHDDKYRWHHVNKIHTRIRMKDGRTRYYSLRFLRYLIDYGTCSVVVPRSIINIMKEYEDEFVPLMESQGWKRTSITTDTPYEINSIK